MRQSNSEADAVVFKSGSQQPYHIDFCYLREKEPRKTTSDAQHFPYKFLTLGMLKEINGIITDTILKYDRKMIKRGEIKRGDLSHYYPPKD
ncbi:MAG: hypothetical protein OXC62_12420 [Aestuariivita sp.]|nr:hypothetical protein [Aestuariivita sp.]